MDSQEFNIDQFKDSWKAENKSKKYSQNEVLDMLSAKSINNAKYILWISLIEFALGLISVPLYYMQELDIPKSLSPEMAEGVLKVYTYLEYAVIIHLLVSIYFIYRFFRKYQDIKADDTLKSFVKNLISFRAWVKYYIIFVFVFFITTFYGSIFYVYFSQSSQYTFKELGLMIGISTVLCIFGLIFMALVYRVIYGILLKKLKRNLDEIQKMEE